MWMSHSFLKRSTRALVHADAEVAEQFAQFEVGLVQAAPELVDFRPGAADITGVAGLLNHADAEAQAGQGLRQGIVQLVGQHGAFLHDGYAFGFLVPAGFGDGHAEVLADVGEDVFDVGAVGEAKFLHEQVVDAEGAVLIAQGNGDVFQLVAGEQKVIHHVGAMIVVVLTDDHVAVEFLRAQAALDGYQTDFLDGGVVQADTADQAHLVVVGEQTHGACVGVDDLGETSERFLRCRRRVC